jgi:hypothetical protein
MRALEVADELGDDLAFAAHRPEAQRARVAVALRATDDEQGCSDD